MSLAGKLRTMVIATVAVMIASIAVLSTAPGARATETPAASEAAFLTVSGRVLGVAATSAANAWAVGYTGYLANGDAQMLIAHWNGRRWSLIPDLPFGQITQITVDAPDDAWAIAQADAGGPFLIHWNGRTWSQDTTVPPVVAYLTAVVAVDGQVWATGSSYPGKGGASDGVMLHRVHGRWYVVPVPGTTSNLDSFAAISPTNIWAGGGLLMHWNGAEWKLASLPKSIGPVFIGGMATGPHGTAWAGASGVSDADDSFSLHWTGKVWTKVPFPRPSGESNGYGGIAPIPGGTDWIVGTSLNGNGSKAVALILHWTGKAWQPVKTPATTFGNVELADVAATSPDNAWAVGVGTCIQEHCGVQDTFILHWNGKAWAY